MHIWFLLGITSAFATSLSLLVGKQLSSKIDPLIATWLGYAFSVIFQVIILFMTSGWPKVTPSFFVLITISACLDGIALTSTMYALRLTFLSIISPIDAFTPLFSVASTLLLLHQPTQIHDLIGIILIVIGAYALNLKEAHNNWLKPIVKLLSDRGVQLMLLASVVKGVSPIIQNNAIHQTHPTTALAASVVSFSILLVILLPFVWQRIKAGEHIKIEHIWLAVLFGAIASIVTYTGWKALSMTNPSYVVAIGRMSIIFGMLWGAWFLKERVTVLKFCAGAIMTLGVILLAF